MGEFDSIWTKYWLRSNPFFTEPLEINGGPVPIENAVGRQKEKKELTQAIKMGGGTRILIIGNAGVGKTTLVNYVRSKARNERFVSPIKEISIPIKPHPQRVMVETLVLIYDELSGVTISPELKKKLDYLKPIADLESYEGEGSEWLESTSSALISIFKELTKEVKSLGYSGIIIHYNNLDKIKDEDTITNFFQDFREFLQNQDVIFLFLGDNLIYSVISSIPRLKQIFQFPIIEMGELSQSEIVRIIERRIELLRIDNTKSPQILEDDVIKILYELFNGNIRDILNSISFAFRNMPTRNMPTPISVSELRDILYKSVEGTYLKKLSQTEKQILKIILDNVQITPSLLSKLSSKHPQNISAHYLKKLVSVKAVELLEIRGRERFYGAVPEIKWWKLQKSETEKKQEEQMRTERLRRMQEFQTLVDDFK